MDKIETTIYRLVYRVVEIVQKTPKQADTLIENELETYRAKTKLSKVKFYKLICDEFDMIKKNMQGRMWRGNDRRIYIKDQIGDLLFFDADEDMSLLKENIHQQLQVSFPKLDANGILREQYEYLVFNLVNAETAYLSILNQTIAAIKSSNNKLVKKLNKATHNTPQPSTAIEIPEELNTPKARVILDKAIKAGLMEQRGKGYKWLGQVNEFAAFVECSSDTLNLKYSNGRIKWTLYKKTFAMEEREIRNAQAARRDYIGEFRAKPDKWNQIVKICTI